VSAEVSGCTTLTYREYGGTYGDRGKVYIRAPEPDVKANDGETRRYGIVTDGNLSCSVVAGLATCSERDRATACPRDPVQRTRRDHVVGDSGRWRPFTGPVPCVG
jgi:hypothetical protein